MTEKEKGRGSWEPISAAPRDGTNILLTDGSCIASGGWDRKREEWWSWAGADANGPRLSPTHWMALPDPVSWRQRAEKAEVALDALKAALRALPRYRVELSEAGLLILAVKDPNGDSVMWKDLARLLEE